MNNMESVNIGDKEKNNHPHRQEGERTSEEQAKANKFLNDVYFFLTNNPYRTEYDPDAKNSVAYLEDKETSFIVKDLLKRAGKNLLSFLEDMVAPSEETQKQLEQLRNRHLESAAKSGWL